MEPEYEEFKEIKKEGQKPSTQLFKNVSEKHILLIIVLIFIGAVVYLKYPKQGVNILLVGGGIIIIYLLYLLKTRNNKEVIPRYIAQRIAAEDLMKEIGNRGCFRAGTIIRPTGYCHLTKYFPPEGDPAPIRWEIGFVLNGAQEVLYYLHPYEGYCMGIIGKRLGYDATESKDIFPKIYFDAPDEP